MAEARPYIGGQALIEGVMMRCPAGVSIAVRTPDGGIAVREGPARTKLRGPAWKLPGLRGVASLIDALTIGAEAMRFSAERAGLDDESASESSAAPHVSETQNGPSPERPAEGSGRMMVGVATLFALGLFVVLPQLMATLVSGWIGIPLGPSDPAFHALAGAFKLTIFFGYILVLSRTALARRVFQYHGAEHKTIAAYEAELPLTVENVRRQSTLHPRCGTTFLVVVVFVSVALGVLVVPFFTVHLTGVTAWLVALVLRLMLLLPTAAISFELQRFFARYCTMGPLQVLLWPGFLFQKITTREPDDAQIEIAIASMKAAIARETKADRSAEETEQTFENFEHLNASLTTP